MPEQVTLLLVDADWILTMDSERRVIKHGAVAINGDKIVAVGPTAEIVHQYQAPAVRSLKGRLVMPGLIDGHIHSSFQLSRGLADEVGSQNSCFNACILTKVILLRSSPIGRPHCVRWKNCAMASPV